MKEVFKAEQIAENVYWVGAVDWNVRNFHGYQTGRGSTYNAFLVIDEKVTLIDTVKAPFFNEMLARIRSVIDFEYEKTIADVNRTLTGIETIFLLAEPQYAHISSSAVRELLFFGKEVSAFLPEGMIIEDEHIQYNNSLAHR